MYVSKYFNDQLKVMPRVIRHDFSFYNSLSACKLRLMIARLRLYNTLMTSSVNIRIATPADASAVRRIYGPYILETAVTSEYEVPEVEEFERRIANTLQRYPYLVAELDGTVVGFTYAAAFRPRVGTKHAVETSIYVQKDLKRGGIGGRLYRTLGNLLLLQNIYNMNACIAYCEPEDEYVPKTSRLFHEKMGYKPCATFTNCSRKFGRWYDLLFMEKLLVDEFPSEDKPFIPFPELSQSQVEEVLQAVNS